MPSRTVITNFTSGVMDSSVKDRFDMQTYRNAVAVLQNVRIKPQGGVTRRPGHTVLAVLPQANYQPEPWVFKDGQCYTAMFYGSGVDIWDKASRTLVASIGGQPWTNAMIANKELCVIQLLDKMFVSHSLGTFDIVVITRTGFSTFTTGPFAYTTDTNNLNYGLPFHKYADSAITMTLSSGVANASVTATLSAAYFVAGHVNLQFRYRGKLLLCTAVTDSTHATMTVQETAGISTITADMDWDVQAFNAVHGYARVLGMHGQRMTIFGARDAPNVIWRSTAANAFSFNLGTGADGDAIKYTITSDRVAEAKSLVSYEALQLFTSQAEFYVPIGFGTAETPGNFSIKKSSGYGCNGVRAKAFDKAAVFITRLGDALRANILQENFQQSYASDTLTFMAESLFYIKDKATGVVSRNVTTFDVQFDGDGSQEARLYAVTSDGTMAVLARVQEQNIAGWNQWTTQGSYKAIAVVDREPWIVVQRTINGMTQNYLEVVEAAALLDFSAQLSGASSTRWGPFPLHKNQLVHVRSGRMYFGQMTVDSLGYVTLPIARTTCEVGLNFVPTITPLKQEVQLADGLTIGEPKRTVSVTANLVDTLSCTINKDRLPSLDSDEDPSLDPPYYQGQFQSHALGWSSTFMAGQDVMPTIMAPDPLPFTCNSIVVEVEV